MIICRGREGEKTILALHHELRFHNLFSFPTGMTNRCSKCEGERSGRSMHMRDLCSHTCIQPIELYSCAVAFGPQDFYYYCLNPVHIKVFVEDELFCLLEEFL